jgi:hypothetical protein
MGLDDHDSMAEFTTCLNTFAACELVQEGLVELFPALLA